MHPYIRTNSSRCCGQACFARREHVGDTLILIFNNIYVEPFQLSRQEPIRPAASTPASPSLRVFSLRFLMQNAQIEYGHGS